MRYLSHFVFIGYFFLFISCKKYSPAPDAFFITSPNVAVSTTSAQGSSSNKISDLYLYVNGQFQGAYPVGHTMPIVSRDASVKLDVFAGIKNNGIKDLSITWLLYDKITFDTLVKSGASIVRPFTFKYNPNVIFLWQENFDNPIGYSLVKSTSFPSDTTFKITSPSNSFEGKSAEITLTGNIYKEAQVESAVSYSIPTGNSNVYLELNYKCTQEFLVGLTDGINLKPALWVAGHSDWNKIYIQLANAASSSPTSNSYKVFFKLIKNSDVSEAHIWLDNIKLVYL